MNDKTTNETLIGPAKVGGKRWMPGDKVEVTAAIKKQLQESGGLPMPVVDPDEVEQEDFTPETQEERVSDILAALNKGVVKTITEKAEGFNKTGIAALIKELGWMPDPEDVNAALELYTAKE